MQTTEETKADAGLAVEILEIAEVRAKAEGLQGNTLARHRCAINALTDVLNGSSVRLTRPGMWVSLYAREASTSTVISNMKFLASILEWAGAQGYEKGDFYRRVAVAIRQALAVKA